MTAETWRWVGKPTNTEAEKTEIVSGENPDASTDQTSSLLLGSEGASDETQIADLRLLVCALATKLKLTCDSNICVVSKKGVLTFYVGLRKLGVLIACGSRGVLLYRQTAVDLRQVNDHFPTILAALMALLREG